MKYRIKQKASSLNEDTAIFLPQVRKYWFTSWQHLNKRGETTDFNCEWSIADALECIERHKLYKPPVQLKEKIIKVD